MARVLGGSYWTTLVFTALCGGLAILEAWGRRVGLESTGALTMRRAIALLVATSAGVLFVVVNRGLTSSALGSQALLANFAMFGLALWLAVVAVRRQSIWWAVATVAGLQSLLMVRLASYLLLPRPTDLAGAPTLPAQGWTATLGLWGVTQFAGLGLGGFFLAAWSATRGDWEASVRWTRMALGALLPEPVLGTWYSYQLMVHYTPSWAMLMGGQASGAWHGMTIALVVSFTVAVALIWLAPAPSQTLRGKAVERQWTLWTLGGLAAGIEWGGAVMRPEFTREMLVLLVASLAGAISLGLISWRALVGIGGFSAIAAVAFFALAWSQSHLALAYRNHLVVRPQVTVPGESAAKIQYGRQLSQAIGCFTCHGVDGRGLRPNPGDPWEWVPSWSSQTFVAQFDGPGGYQKLWTLLWEGQYAYRIKFYPHGGNWSVNYHTLDNYFNVPSWSGIVTRSQMDAIIRYVQSLGSPAGPAGGDGHAGIARNPRL